MTENPVLRDEMWNNVSKTKLSAKNLNNVESNKVEAVRVSLIKKEEFLCKGIGEFLPCMKIPSHTDEIYPKKSSLIKKREFLCKGKNF